MSAPSIEDLCKDIEIDAELSAGLSLILPGGAELSASLPSVDIMVAGDLAKQLMASANAALAPLVPLFNIIDVVLLLFKAVKAIPDMLGPPPDPSGLLRILPELVAKVDKLIAIIPPASIPITVKGLLTVLIAFLKGIRAQLEAVISLNAEIAAADARADSLAIELPSVSAQLKLSVGCSRATASAMLQGMGQSAAPFNRLVGLINLLAGLAQLPEVPTMADLGADAKAALTPIDGAVSALEALRATIP